MGCTLKELEQYYYEEHKNKIFCTRLSAEGRSFAILYDYDKKDEIQKFVENFTEYFPYYVYNADALECIESIENIGDKLEQISKKCWISPNVPPRKLASNGIFGEVFLDFYERIIKKEKLASTYASRRDFRSKDENKGYDNVLFKVKDGEIEFVFAEAKFVVNRTKAKSELISDIVGTPKTENHKAIPGHLTLDFMNDYIKFVVEKNAFFSDEDKVLLKPFLHELNMKLINGDGNFISYLIEKDIKVNCVFFAIFCGPKKKPADYISAYDSIKNTAANYLTAMGIKNYNIEIVFIPTDSKSMEIKGAIDGYYR